MSFYVNASQEKTFQLVTDYFNGRQMKILTSDAPSHIRAEFGSWFALGLGGNEKGEVEANVVERNGGSFVNLNLDFSKLYFYSLAVFATIVVIGVSLYQMLEMPFWWTLIVFSGVSIMALFGVGYSVSITRKRFIEEFNMFIQSLASKK